MATKTNEYTLKFNAETGEAKIEIDKLKKALEETEQQTEATKEGMSALDAFTGGFASKAKAAIGKIRGMTKGFKSLKVAIAATGIGLLVVAVGSLFTFFTKTKRGSEALQKGMAWMEGFFGIITDQIAGFGETIVNAFENPQQAIKDLWEAIQTNLLNRFKGFIDAWIGIKDVIQSVFTLDWDAAKKGAEDFGKAMVQVATGMDEIQQQAFVENLKEISKEASKAADASLALAKRQQQLDDSNRALNLTFEQQRAKIKELNKIGEDTSKSDEERIAAIQQAIDIETNLMAQREFNAARQVEIYKEQNSLSESTAEDLDRLNQAEIELSRVKLESTELQTTLQNKLNTTLDQQRIEKETKAKESADREAQIAKDAADIKFALMEEGIGKELEVAQRKFDELELKAGENHALKKEIEEARASEFAAIKKKYIDIEAAEAEKAADEKIASEEKVSKAKKDVAQGSLQTIANIAAIFAGKSEKSQKRAFKIQKAANIANVAIDTIKGAQGALSSFSSIPVVGTILGAVAAAGVVAAGVLNIKKIKDQKFQGGGGGVTPSKPNIPNLSAASQSATTPPSLEEPQFGGEAENEPIQAYVVATEVQDSNEASQKVEDIATL